MNGWPHLMDSVCRYGKANHHFLNSNVKAASIPCRFQLLTLMQTSEISLPITTSMKTHQFMLFTFRSSLLIELCIAVKSTHDMCKDTVYIVVIITGRTSTKYYSPAVHCGKHISYKKKNIFIFIRGVLFHSRFATG